MGTEDILSLVVGLLQLTLAVVVLRHLGRFGRAFPWLAALMAFFALRAVNRIYAAFAGDEPAALTLATDIVLIGVLGLLIAGVERTASGLRGVEEEARRRQDEYERALHDYRTLARHRLANPLTVIRGGVTTLRALPHLTADEREELLATIDDAAARLEQVALEAEPASAEERDLDPRPHVDRES